MPRIITLTGASGSGKSSTIRVFLSKYNEHFHPITVQKCTTRSPRKDDNPDEVQCVASLPQNLDLVYQQYDVRYGLEARELSSALDSGQSPLVVLNDIRTITEVRSLFGRLVLPIYVFRAAPSRSMFVNFAKERGQRLDDNPDLEKRLKKAEAIYRIYIENIHLFSRVILNTRGFSELDLQVDRIVQYISAADVGLEGSGFTYE